MLDVCRMANKQNNNSDWLNGNNIHVLHAQHSVDGQLDGGQTWLEQ